MKGSGCALGKHKTEKNLVGGSHFVTQMRPRLCNQFSLTQRVISIVWPLDVPWNRTHGCLKRKWKCFFFLVNYIFFFWIVLVDVVLFALIPEDSEVAACRNTCIQARGLCWPPSPHSSFPHPFCLPLLKHQITKSVIYITSEAYRRCSASMIHTCFLVKQFVGTPAAFETFLKTQETFAECIIKCFAHESPWHKRHTTEHYRILKSTVVRNIFIFVRSLWLQLCDGQYVSQHGSTVKIFWRSHSYLKVREEKKRGWWGKDCLEL